MKRKLWLLVPLAALAIAGLGWEALNLAIENDGLRQVAEGDKRSIQALLSYASVATRCGVTPQELADSLKTTVHPSSTDNRAAEVAYLAFRAEFVSGTLASVEIGDVGKVSVCGREVR
jgi:hypothetical protein